MYWSPLSIPELRGLPRDEAIALLVKANKGFNPWLRVRAVCAFAVLAVPATMTAERGHGRPLLGIGMGAILFCYWFVEWNTSMRRAVAAYTEANKSKHD